VTATTVDHAVDDPPAEERPDLPWPYVVLGLLCAYLPLVFLGYGTDIDAANVLRAGRSILHGHYEISRGPGAVPHEAATAVLDRVGGPILVNLAGVGFAVLAVWCVHRLLVRDGARWPALATVVLVANPWFWIASTSVGDFTWALALALAGCVAARADRRVLSGVLFGVAIGCRASSALLALAWLLAERTGSADEDDDPVPWRDTLVTAGTLAVVGAACFVPPWMAADRSWDFLHNQLDFVGWRVHAGRFLVKNLATATLPGALVLLVGGRWLLAGLARWRASTVVRFAVVSVVLLEVLFFRLPFKPVHLLPVVAATALLVGAARIDHRRWIAALVAAQLVAAFVGLTLAAPDVPDHATGGRIALRVADGVVVNDVRCRLADLERGRYEKGDSEAEEAVETARAEANFVCQRDAWRGP
jgi:hypothetical protein